MEAIYMRNGTASGRNSSEAFGFLALATLGSANRWICGSLTLAQICSLRSQTSHIPRTLYEIAGFYHSGSSIRSVRGVSHDII